MNNSGKVVSCLWSNRDVNFEEVKVERKRVQSKFSRNSVNIMMAKEEKEGEKRSVWNTNE